MIRKLLPVVLVLVLLSPVIVKAQQPFVFVACDYLLFDLDARIAGTCGISVVAPPSCPEAGLRMNPALMSADQRYFTVNSNTSSILLFNDISQWGTELTGSFAFNKNNVVGFSTSYYDHGEVYFADQGDPESLPSGKVYDLFTKISYAHSFGKGLSVGGAFRFSHSDYTDIAFDSGRYVSDINGVSFDVGFSYYHAFRLSKHFGLGLNTGLSAVSMGPRVDWDAGYTTVKAFQPATLFAGLMVTPFVNLPSDWLLSLDLAYQADKQMTPSPPKFGVDVEGGVTIISGKDPDVSACRGMFQSFYDSPDGFKGEMEEIGHRASAGIRAGHGNRLYFAIGYGHTWRPRLPGYTTYGAGGLSLGLFGFHLDFYHILDTENHIDGWTKNFGFSLGFRGNLSGKMFTF